MSWRGQRLRRGLAAIAVVGGLAAAGLGWFAATVPPLTLEPATALSATVLDRQGRLLRAFTTPDGRWRLPVTPAEVDPRYLAMLTAFEDRRFHAHGGVDVTAVGRAAVQALRHGRLVSGASTLTMQVARLVAGEHERTAVGKLRQMVRAIRLERALTKDQILTLYLRLAPFGGNLEGVRAASLAYFGKEPRRLSVGEAALLVALPQSPELRRPDRFAAAAGRARSRVLAVAVARGVISQAEAQHADREPVPSARRDFPNLAPHLTEAEIARAPAQPVHRLTLDRDVQAQLERLAREHARAIGSGVTAAILAVEHATGAVVAHVGSSDYFDASRKGAIDMVRAVRSPGSTLKPLIYGLAFEAGLAHPETLIEDRPVRFGTYSPKNFDEEFRGTVSIREALAASLNIPAVKALEAVGPGKLLGRMRVAGVHGALPPPLAEPTLAVALGGVGLSLHDLATLYATLARGGEPVALSHLPRGAGAPAAAVSAARPALLSAVASWYVTDILKDAPPPTNARTGRIAYKTGTSYGYRDAWAVGYDGRHTIAVWVGRADGAATPGISGRASAAPVLFDAFQRIATDRAPLPPAPAGALKVAGSALPPPLKRFAEAGEAALTGPYLDQPVTIAFPPDRAELEPADGDAALILKAEGGALPLTWLADGEPIVLNGTTREITWEPKGRGFVRLSVIDAKGRADRVVVRLR